MRAVSVVSPATGKESVAEPDSTVTVSPPASARVVAPPRPSRLAALTTASISGGSAEVCTSITSGPPRPWRRTTPCPAGWLKNTKSPSARTRPDESTSSADTSSGAPPTTVTRMRSPGAGRFSPRASAVTPRPRGCSPTSHSRLPVCPGSGFRATSAGVPVPTRRDRSRAVPVGVPVDPPRAGEQGGAMSSEERAGVPITNADQPLFDGAEATKRDLLDYLEAVAEQFIGQLRDRPLSVVRVRAGQKPFMQKTLPKYAPDFVPRVTTWAASVHKQITYPLCQDLPTLMWMGNQRAVEYHPTLLTT